ncbi:uncharacterized protein SCHCODRAFT_02481155 [Schizophyllum commune H4-8]|uniref:HMA domain-containing protein n=1 Tax=Schizophyllum commune (strain H4-8 / FGSC 9210) TaxID=578458 RepID=D8PT58_SCHCM|nr:uncharacterized protein SCHCODRAFT_02481155 [Schizophyllum commune H4-8]KAI5899425.1 hypothetical protein SCHCODRAFT_02481155 [Schizophyllum commune H4-8]
MVQAEQTYKFNVKMTCTGCSGLVSRALHRAKGDGVRAFTVDLDRQEVIVTGTIPYDEVVARIARTGRVIQSGAVVRK